MFRTFRPAITLLVLFSALTGIIYPLLVTGASLVLFHDAASGSLLSRDGKIVGSRLIGQAFSSDRYFWSRPSATTPMANNAASSGGSNLGPTNPALFEAVGGRVKTLRAGTDTADAIPADLVTTSASGLDPDISPAAAHFQAARVARVRSLPLDKVSALVDAHVTPPQWGFLGEARVNVLELNLSLDALAPSS